jgi:hypothetical protein
VFVFATSDKGGTGRSVTSCNIVYRRALQGSDVCYLDFDFGSPTAGSIFQIDEVERGTPVGGLHSYLKSELAQPERLDVWSRSDRESLRGRPDGAGQLVLFPGDISGGEFPSSPQIVNRCVELLLRLDEEFDLVLVDLSAGRSFATEIVLRATAHKALRKKVHRWIVYHRWTRQHIIAASGLIYGEQGLIKTGVACGHDEQWMRNAIRLVRTAVVDPQAGAATGLSYEQIAWLRVCNEELLRQASLLRVGSTLMIGQVPLDPVLQWREQLISDTDTITRHIANRATVEAFDSIAKRLGDDEAWIGI